MNLGHCHHLLLPTSRINKLTQVGYVARGFPMSKLPWTDVRESHTRGQLVPKTRRYFSVLAVPDAEFGYLRTQNGSDRRLSFCQRFSNRGNRSFFGTLARPTRITGSRPLPRTTKISFWQRPSLACVWKKIGAAHLQYYSLLE